MDSIHTHTQSRESVCVCLCLYTSGENGVVPVIWCRDKTAFTLQCPLWLMPATIFVFFFSLLSCAIWNVLHPRDRCKIVFPTDRPTDQVHALVIEPCPRAYCVMLPCSARQARLCSYFRKRLYYGPKTSSSSSVCATAFSHSKRFTTFAFISLSLSSL